MPVLERVATTTRASQPQGVLPLVIGVTGHRDLRSEDIPRLEERVRSIFAELQKKCPHTPLILLSPLAEGADRLVARIALEQGARLVSPFPLPQAEYEKDFETPDVREEFYTLLGRADRSLEMPYLPGNTPENIHENDRRAEQYALVGAYIVENCQLLIALWNGVLLSDGGGTGQIVSFQCKGVPDRYRDALSDDTLASRSFLEPVETGPTFHIVTPRSKHPGLVGEAFAIKKYFPKDAEDGENTVEIADSDATVELVYTNIEEFNINAVWAESDPAMRTLIQRNAGYLLSSTLTEELPDGLKILRHRYAVADTLAQYFQQRTFTVLKWLSVIVFLSALSFELTAKLATDNYWLALIFPGMIAVAWSIWLATVNRNKWQDRYQDYRAFAEGLRVEFFWRMGGVPTSVAENYLQKQRSELDWIRIAIHNLSESAAAAGFTTTDTKDHLALVQEHWVTNQRRYFSRAAHRDDAELERYEKIISLLIAASPAIALLTAGIGLSHSPLAEWMHHNPIVHKLLIIAVFVLAGLAGVLHTYVDKKALAEHTKQYERMGRLFQIAEQQLKIRMENGNHEEARLLLLELGKESLAENGDWLMTHRNRPVDVPHAG